METKLMQVNGKEAYVTKYEIIEAFFRTEEEEDVNMAKELNKMINVFCEKEQQTKRNVISLPFNIETHGNVINYINDANNK